MLCIESQVTPSPGCSSTRCLNNIFPPKGVLVLETERGGCIIKGYENEGKNQEYVICGGKRLCVGIKNKIKLWICYKTDFTFPKLRSFDAIKIVITIAKIASNRDFSRFD